MNLRFHLLIPLVFQFTVINSFAQKFTEDKLLKNCVYFEIAGNAPLVSLNYERTFKKHESLALNYHTGIGYDRMEFTSGKVHVFSFPIEMGLVLFEGKHHIEGGIGVTPFLSRTRTWSKFIYAEDENLSDHYKIYFLVLTEIGYRYQKPGGRWIFRACFSPIWYNSSDWDPDAFRVNFGLAAGRCF